MPWEEIRGRTFEDLDVYYNYFLHQQSILDYKTFGDLLDYIVSEALWHLSISTLIDGLGIDIDYVFLIISSLCLTVFAILLARRHGAGSVLLLANPLLIDLAFAQLRSALAFSLLYIAYLLRRRIAIYLLLTAAVFIHTASILFIALFAGAAFAYRYMRKTDRSDQTIFFALCLIGIMVSIVVGPLRAEILAAIGDRRASLQGGASSSLLFTSFWVIALLVQGFQAKHLVHDEISRFSIIILAMVTCNLLTGGYTSRFLALTLPFLLSSVLRMRSPVNFLVIALYIFYTTVQWIYWFDIRDWRPDNITSLIVSLTENIPA